MKRKILALLLNIEIIFTLLFFSIFKSFSGYKYYFSLITKKNVYKYSVTKECVPASIYRKIIKASSILKINSCLIKSASLFRILRSMSMKPELVICVLDNENTFKSHAYIKIDSISFDKPNKSYKIIKIYA